MPPPSSFKENLRREDKIGGTKKEKYQGKEEKNK
jgi:hypothetical protein